MEVAGRANMTEFSPYGSTHHKQVYIYGALNQSSISFPNNRSFGMYWGVGGWLLTPFLANAGMEKALEGGQGLGPLNDEVCVSLALVHAQLHSQAPQLGRIEAQHRRAGAWRERHANLTEDALGLGHARGLRRGLGGGGGRGRRGGAGR